MPFVLLFLALLPVESTPQFQAEAQRQFIRKQMDAYNRRMGFQKYPYDPDHPMPPVKHTFKPVTKART